jgi:hypothetical protein
MTYYLFFRNNIYNYFKLIGYGKDKNKSITQSKNFILDYLRRNKINLKYTNTIKFELDLLKLLQEENKDIYKINNKYNSISFFFLKDIDKNLITNDYILNDKLIYNKLIFEEDIEVAKQILNLKEYMFDIDIIEYPKLKLKYSNNFFIKKRSKSI